MRENGWIKLYRKLLHTELWTSEKFTRGQAWVDLLLLTNHKNGFIRVAGQRIEVKRGQCAWSVKRLSERWSWSRNKVQRFLDELQQVEQQITQEKSTRTTLITVLRYEEFQGLDANKKTSEYTTEWTSDFATGETTDVTTDVTLTRKNKKYKKNKEKSSIAAKKENAAAAFFDDELESLLAAIVEKRVSDAKRRGKPISSIGGLKESLKAAYLSNPSEADNWRAELGRQAENLEAETVKSERAAEFKFFEEFESWFDNELVPAVQNWRQYFEERTPTSGWHVAEILLSLYPDILCMPIQDFLRQDFEFRQEMYELFWRRHVEEQSHLYVVDPSNLSKAEQRTGKIINTVFNDEQAYEKLILGQRVVSR